MEFLGQFLVNRTRAWVVVVLCLAVSGWCLYMAKGVEHEDDILAFLPRENPDVQLFSEINQRFGGLDLALVGLAAPDVLDRDFLARLRQATDELKDTKGLDHVLSLTNMVDFTPDREKGGIVTALLIDELPGSREQREALRHKVMSRDHVVGNLISRDGGAVLIYCFLAYGSDQKELATGIRAVVDRAFPEGSPVKKYWGGGPFIATYIYTTTQRDMQRLTPWAVGAIVLIMMLAFRDIKGTCLALISTGMGIVISLGAMAALGVRFNIVLSSMPVILFAIGSAYGIHVLARYYALTQEHGPDRAMVLTLRGVGPTVLAAGLTTAASLLSFVWMDIKPLRTFGVFTALGITSTLLLSLTFIPAVASIAGLHRKQTSSAGLRHLIVKVTVFAQQRRLPVALVLSVLAVAGLLWTARVDSRMDLSTFFSKGSPPDQAQSFLVDHFGGSQFVQIYLEGDMNDPRVLREVRALADEVALLPHVSSVLHLGDAVSRVNEIMVGQRRIPDQEAQVRLLYSFLAGDPSVAQLVTADRSQSLMHVKVDSNLASVLEPLISRMEQLCRDRIPAHFRVANLAGSGSTEAAGRLRRQLLLHLQFKAQLHGQPLNPGQLAELDRGLSRPATRATPAAVASALERFIRSEECAVELPEDEDPAAPLARRVASALAALGPETTEDAVASSVAAQVGRSVEDDLVQDLTLSLAGPLAETWRLERAAATRDSLLAAAGIKLPASVQGRQLGQAFTAALLDLDLTTALLPVAGDGKATGQLRSRVNGLPVMHRGLSHSVMNNQIKSLGFALALVLVIMTVLFRSLWTGLLVSVPTLLTLLIIYGGMGLLGIRLDIGTSMLASIIMGAGVDYAVHLAAAWRAPPNYLPPHDLKAAAARAADESGPAIWTNAIMVCAGFFVLTLGEARPLQNVGGLTAAAMLTAALATFLAFPALARRSRYRNQDGEVDGAVSSDVVDAVLRGSKI